MIRSSKSNALAVRSSSLLRLQLATPTSASYLNSNRGPGHSLAVVLRQTTRPHIAVLGRGPLVPQPLHGGLEGEVSFHWVLARR